MIEFTLILSSIILTTVNALTLDNESVRIAIAEYFSNGDSSFYGPISTWDTSDVTNLDRVFKLRKSFNGNISNWNTSKVTTTKGMLKGAESFNGNLSTWDVSNVEFMDKMFSEAKAFNSEISQWSVSKVSNMSYMFESASSFNINLSQWDIGNVDYMHSMFDGTLSMDQELCWDMSNVAEPKNMNRNSLVSLQSYPDCLNTGPTEIPTSKTTKPTVNLTATPSAKPSKLPTPKPSSSPKSDPTVEPYTQDPFNDCILHSKYKKWKKKHIKNCKNLKGKKAEVNKNGIPLSSPILSKKSSPTFSSNKIQITSPTITTPSNTNSKTIEIKSKLARNTLNKITKALLKYPKTLSLISSSTTSPTLSVERVHAVKNARTPSNLTTKSPASKTTKANLPLTTPSSPSQLTILGEETILRSTKVPSSLTNSQTYSATVSTTNPSKISKSTKGPTHSHVLKPTSTTASIGPKPLTKPKAEVWVLPKQL